MHLKNASETVKDFKLDCTTLNFSLISPFLWCPTTNECRSTTKYSVCFLHFNIWIWCDHHDAHLMDLENLSLLKTFQNFSKPSKPGKMRNRSVDMHVHESIGLLALKLMRHAVGLDN